MFGVPLRNLALFATVNIVATVALGVIFLLLDSQFGFDGGSSASWIPSFAVACLVAGRAYAKGSGWTWTREDRRNLAMAYAAAAFLIGLVIALGAFAFDPNVFATLGAFWGIFLLVFGGLFGSLISYALARLLLGRAVRRSGNPDDHPSKVRN
ncbi:ABZJ_00895 family protein [Brevundimonas sp.]|uniref:ABZJ_00895 family protein n=1 Tax=Brevundimonas sp. TaxID=1871086 RepID=UPI0035667536